MYIEYDGSFEGYLNALYYILKNKISPNKISFKKNLFNIESIKINSNIKIFDYMSSYLKRSVSSLSLHKFYHCFLSNFEDKDLLAIKYIILALKYPKVIDNYETNDIVINVNKYSKRVSFESHRFLGILRFKLLKNNFYFSKINPDNLIIPLISNHFVKRLSNENWIIFDENHMMAAIYEEKNLSIGLIKSFKNIDFMLEEEEILYEEFWKKYYKSISIKERKNDRLRKNFMPYRYWKNLIEIANKKSEL